MPHQLFVIFIFSTFFFFKYRIAMFALNLSEYFDGLVSELDVRIETLISDNIQDHELVSKMNLVREDFIRQIRDCQSINMTNLPNIQANTSQPTNNELFKSFCFFIDVDKEEAEVHLSKWNNVVAFIGWHLIVLDTYLAPAQIQCFQEILKFLPCNYYDVKERDKNVFFEVNAQHVHVHHGMRIENDLFTFSDPSRAIVKGPAATMLAFNSLTLDNLLIESIRPEASFLFARVTRLHLLDIKTTQVADIVHTLELFQRVSPHLDYIQLELQHLYTSANLMPLREYPIKALKLTQNVGDNFNMVQLNKYECFTDLTQLTLNRTNVNLIDARMFEYFPKLEQLMLNFNTILEIARGAFDLAGSLKKLDISFNRLAVLQANILRGLVSLLLAFEQKNPMGFWQI